MAYTNIPQNRKFKADVEDGKVTQLQEQGYTYAMLCELYGVSMSTVARRVGSKPTKRRRRGQKSPTLYFSPTPAQKLALCSAW